MVLSLLFFVINTSTSSIDRNVAALIYCVTVFLLFGGVDLFGIATKHVCLILLHCECLCACLHP